MEDLESIRVALKEFVKERDWGQFHSPKNLVMALSVEVSELVECFQWLSEEESYTLSSKKKSEVMDEIADVQLYLIMLADKLEVDIIKSTKKKINKNSEKYPAEKVKGKSKKYNEY